MTKRPTNFHHNYPAVTKWLRENDIEFHELNDGLQLRIMGPVAIVDLWPSRMKVHVVATEGVDPNQYFSLDWNFKPKQLEKLLNGESI